MLDFKSNLFFGDGIAHCSLIFKPIELRSPQGRVNLIILCGMTTAAIIGVLFQKTLVLVKLGIRKSRREDVMKDGHKTAAIGVVDVIVIINLTLLVYMDFMLSICLYKGCSYFVMYMRKPFEILHTAGSVIHQFWSCWMLAYYSMIYINPYVMESFQVTLIPTTVIAIALGFTLGSLKYLYYEVQVCNLGNNLYSGRLIMSKYINFQFLRPIFDPIPLILDVLNLILVLFVYGLAKCQQWRRKTNVNVVPHAMIAAGTCTFVIECPGSIVAFYRVFYPEALPRWLISPAEREFDMACALLKVLGYIMIFIFNCIYSPSFVAGAIDLLPFTRKKN